LHPSVRLDEDNHSILPRREAIGSIDLKERTLLRQIESSRIESNYFQQQWWEEGSLVVVPIGFCFGRSRKQFLSG